MKEPLQRISGARVRLLAHLPFFGHLALMLRPRISTPDDCVATAAVAPDGTLVVNEAFLAELSDAEVAGLLAHEVMHPALDHFRRQGARVTERWNAATDYSVNLLVQEVVAQVGARRFKLPNGALVDRAYTGMAAEQVYELLLPAIRSAARDRLGGDLRPDLAATGDGRALARGDEAAGRRVADTWAVSLVAAAQAQEQARGQGSLPGAVRRIVEGLTGPPRLDWRTALERYLSDALGPRVRRSWTRPSRRSESAGELLASHQPQGAKVAVMLDTSGSISARRLARALVEIQGIAEGLGTGVRALVVDSDLHADLDQVVDVEEILRELVGNGGSDLRPGFERLAAESWGGVVIAFTDGAIVVPPDRPEELRGVVWAVAPGDRVPTTAYGERVEIPREESQ